MFSFLWIILIVAIVFIISIIVRYKLIIRVDTFFRKGFKKIHDTYGVYAWIGKQGDGKTYSVIDWLNEKSKFTKKKIITNVKSYADHFPNNCIYNPDFYNIIDCFNNGDYDTDYIIFYDELFTLLEKGKLNKNILGFISQLRKRGIYLVTTVQEWLDINVTFRRYVRFYVECKMINFFGCAWSINTIHNGYDMTWNNDINEYESPIIKTTIKKCGKKIADSYDTYEVIENV